MEDVAVISAVRTPIGGYLGSLRDVPAYDLLDMPLYWRERRFAKMVSTRGCPFTCSFCSVHVTLGHEIRKRSIDAIIEELRLLRHTYGVVKDDFEDEENWFTLSTDSIERFFTRGALHIRVIAERTTGWSDTDQELGDFYLELDVTHAHRRFRFC